MTVKNTKEDTMKQMGTEKDGFIKVVKRAKNITSNRNKTTRIKYSGKDGRGIQTRGRICRKTAHKKKLKED